MSSPVQQPDHSFNEELHEYRDNTGLVVPSSTQVLQEVGFYEALEAVEPGIIERKQKIGKVVHRATQLIDQNKLDWTTVRKDCNGYLDAYAAFMDDTGFKPNLIEHRTIAKVHGMAYGMTVDREGLLYYKRQMRRTVLELKCTAQSEEYWGIQTSSYDLGLGGERRLRAAVQLKEDGKYKLFVYDDPAHYQLFVSALSLTWWKINNLSKYRNGFVARSL